MKSNRTTKRNFFDSTLFESHKNALAEESYEKFNLKCIAISRRNDLLCNLAGKTVKKASSSVGNFILNSAERSKNPIGILTNKVIVGKRKLLVNLGSELLEKKTEETCHVILNKFK